MEYNFSESTIEQLILLQYICSISPYPEDQEMRKAVLIELGKREKQRMNIDELAAQ